MKKFRYTAVSKQGKNLNGIISADDIQGARKKLNDLQLSVVSLDELPEGLENETENFKKFKFEAHDKQDKKIIGTISSNDIFTAFTKLVKEYELKVEKIADMQATEDQFESSSERVINFYGQLEQLENIKKTDNSRETFEQEESQKKLQKIIEEVITALKSITNQFADELKPQAKEFLIKYQEHLEKIKYSKNTESVIASAQKVLSHIQSTEMFLSDDKNIQEKLQLKLDALRLSQMIKFESRLNKKSIFEPILKFLEKIGLQRKQKDPNAKSIFSDIKNYFKILFTTKSNNIRKNAFKNAIQSFLSIFRPKPTLTYKSDSGQTTKIDNPKSPIKKQEGQSDLEKQLSTLTTWLVAGYLIFYFISAFLSEKIVNQEIPKIFFIYNTKVLIYIITGVFFLHMAIRLRSLLLEHKISHSKITYSLFSLLYLLILINL